MKIGLRIRSVSLVVAIFLAGCGGSGGPIGVDPSIAVTDLNALPAPSGIGYLQESAVEIVRPLDVLSVSVFGVEELSREEIRVGLEGTFNYPLIGAVQADGRSLAEIAHEMEVRLAGGYVRNPDVQVNFVSREAQVFTIGGEVAQPGQYPVLQPTTLLEAVAIGRGRTDYSQLSEVMIFREVGHQRYIGVFDLAAIQRGNYPDPQIYPQDVIVVGESAGIRRMARIAQIVPLITNPLILLERVAR